MPGPPPKRSDQRRRTNKPAKTPTKSAGATRTPQPPRPDQKWHPAAKRWYASLAKSGQSAFYEPSDWATAWVLAESMSREFSPQPIVVGRGEAAEVQMVTLPPKGASLAAWLKGMTALLATEGDRRRAALELQRPAPPEPEGANVSHLEDARRRLQSG